MVSLETPPVTVSLQDTLPSGSRDPDRGVVFLRGEHDISTITMLSETIARAIAAHDADLVLDLSRVQFMDAATVSVIVRTRASLQESSRRLVLRSPSPSARRVLGLCGFGELLDPTRPPQHAVPVHAAADALGTWVEVPAVGPAIAERPQPPAEGVTINARPVPSATEVGAADGA